GGPAQHAVLRQVGVERTQAVGGPRADGRVRAALADVPARVPLQLRPVVVVRGPQRTHHGDVIGTRPDVFPPVGHHQPAFAVLLVAGFEAHQHFAPAVRGVGGDHVLDARVGEDALVGGGIDGLAGVPVQFGLHVEALDVADAAAQEDPD